MFLIESPKPNDFSSASPPPSPSLPPLPPFLPLPPLSLAPRSEDTGPWEPGLFSALLTHVPGQRPDTCESIGRDEEDEDEVKSRVYKLSLKVIVSCFNL
uniref:Uncharacterized protein n=1 Tax=Knipowitschia caucasica TaxID=637954 RepID=A0AAV2J2A3_KNICA